MLLTVRDINPPTLGPESETPCDPHEGEVRQGHGQLQVGFRDWGMGCSLVEETREPAVCLQEGKLRGQQRKGEGDEFGACGWLLLGAAKKIR